MRKWLRRWRDQFYAGPRFLGRDPPVRKGYTSPTLTAGLWCYALIVRHFTMAGRVVFICSGLVMFYAMFSLHMPVHILAFALLALFGLDAAAGFGTLPRVRVVRDMPARMGAGREDRVRYRLTNMSRRPLWDLAVDTLPFPHPVTLCEGRCHVDALAPGQSVAVETPVRVKRRGRYTLPAVRVDSSFPFHLWRWGCTGTGPQRVLVYPAFTPLRTLTLGTGRRYQAGGIALSSDVGESMEFLGCREFLPGDDPRRLHWRSWARTSYPVAKEFCEEYFCRTALIVDTYQPPQRIRQALGLPVRDAALEAGFSLAAAVAEYLAARDYVIDLFAAGPEVYRFQGGRSLGYLENILDILACLQPHHGEPFREFSAEIAAEIAQISSVVFVLQTWNETRRDLILETAQAGAAVKAWLVTAPAAVPAALPAAVTVLTADDIRAGRCIDL